MVSRITVVESDPDKLGGTVVFKGTRVAVENLFDYIEAGDRLDEFLEDFPTVSREAAIAVLDIAKTAVVATKREDTPSEPPKPRHRCRGYRGENQPHG